MLGINLGLDLGSGSEDRGVRLRSALSSVILTASPSVVRSIERSQSELLTASPSVVAAATRPAAAWTADAGTSLTGADLNSWTDQVNGYVLTPGGAGKPTLSTAAFSGRNAILFSRAGVQWLTNTTTAALYQLANGDDPSISVVWQSISLTATNEEEMWFFGREAGAAADRLSAYSVGSVTTIRLSDNGATGTATVTYTVADVTAAAHVYALVLSGQTQTLYVDGVANGTVGAINATSRTTTTRFNIGNFSSGAAANFDGYMRRFNVYSSALTAAQVGSISNAWSGA